MTKVLIVDDDEKFSDLLAKKLEQRNYEVLQAENTSIADEIIKNDRIDIVLLDLMMPEEDEISFCRRLRKSSDVPVIFISAMNDEFEEVVALEVGGLYFVQKPFNTRVLIAKINKALEISKQLKDKLVEQKIDINCRYRFSGWVFNPTLRTVMNNQNESIHLGVKERDLLCILITRRRPISKAEILKLIYEKDFSYEDNSVNALIYRLRKKLKTILSNEQELILSAYADGYELSEMPTKEELDEM